MDFMQLLGMLLHVDKMLGAVIAQYGTLVYVVLFAIIFCETAFVVLPFLPGDSLLFIAGTFSATGAMNVWVLIVLLVLASILGNTVNYWIGSQIGHRVLERDYRWIDKAALRKTHEFYEKHGGKTVVLARFIPIVRTFAPFVAGISDMTHRTFQIFNVLGALLWIFSLVLSGYFFGNIPFIREHLNSIVLVGVGAAIVPILLGTLWKLCRGWRKAV
ncbi:MULTISPECIES: VTT domain-containing protein [unclassified Undibacterium]|uniref:VTT domain-containing protein n=1 Tax=unclassified Undibacterium TaxID=2630295 RepID=UPI002AC9E374|nr:MULTISPECIES: VTT domain-containing protein [unclassified Undibacterium]MEB0138109.1 VTT domain-containing protein [Undibacterium sp. CCC2.1]MEB0171136.1 VTT domain-containing protein [Undibacterium sp. CCC1.1]MEB0175181.1 VTT domain-containing protein [Undibacterium sp. CCC3.4]MEB0214235.1 VTT domain-containing protein [Undibacterium sp. 5I2]WPX41815.1 VTT domain-containing protein [Undibacterium sp. CCC3.4]